MRLRNIPGAEEALENSKYVIKQPESYRGHFREQIFGNENPIHIEIGMGKGKFLLAMAQQNPAVNYIGIELYSSVLLRAVQKGKPVVIGSTGLGDFYQSAAFHNLQMMGDGRSGQIGLPGDLVDGQPFRVAVLGGNAQCFDDV